MKTQCEQKKIGSLTVSIGLDTARIFGLGQNTESDCKGTPGDLFNPASRPL